MSGFQYSLGEWSWVCHLTPESLSLGFPGGAVVKNPPAKEMQETWVRSLGGEDPLEKEVATHFSILAGKTPWTEEPGWLQSKGNAEWDMTEHTHPSLSLYMCGTVVKNPPANEGGKRDPGSIPGSGRLPGGDVATHSNILA